MGNGIFHEELLHWIWAKQQLSGNLQTTDGESVMVYHPGTLNSSDGPDFINAKITIGHLKWYGDVEIHWEADGWFAHGHENDENYKGVVLHVIFSDPADVSLKPDLPTLWLQPFLSKPLSVFFDGFKNDKGLPCSQNVSFISPAALEAQIAKVHHRYFEQKVDELLQFYNPELPPSQAWQDMLIIALFSGLGISHNREPMQKLANVLVHHYESDICLESLKERALNIAFAGSGYHWKRKGSRPPNRPRPRIKQGCELIWHIKNAPFKHWFNQDIHEPFEACFDMKCKPKVGKKRSGILFGTAWLPAVYLLGNLFGSKPLANAAKQVWNKHRTPLPASITKPFRQAGVPKFVYQRKLGTAHQLKAYCRAQRCHQCEVFKSVISA